MNVGVKFKANFEEVKKGLKDIQEVAKTIRMDGATKDVEKLAKSFKSLNDDAASVAGEVMGISDTVAQLANSLGDADNDLLTNFMDSLSDDDLENTISTLEKMKAEAIKAVDAAIALNNELGSPESEIQLAAARNEMNQISDLLHEIQQRADAVEFEKMRDEIEKSYSAMDRLRQKLQEIDDKAKETDVSTPFKVGTFNVRRFALSIIGMQSVFSLISKSTRQYMEANNALKSSMLGVTSAIGDLFAPLLQRLIGLMQALIRATMLAIAYFKTFMNVIFGTNMQIRYTLKASGKMSKGFNSVGKSAKKAGKNMKKAFKSQISDIDELNVLTTDTSDNLDGVGGNVGGVGDVGDFTVPDMTPFDITDKIAQLQKFAEWLEKNRDWVKALTLALTGFAVAAAVISWIGKVVGALQVLKGWSLEGTLAWQAFSKGLAVIFSPIGLVIGLLVALGVAIYQLWQESEEFRQAWNTIWESIKSIVNSVYEAVIEPILNTIVELFIFLVEHGLKPVWEAFKFLVERVTIAISIILEALAPLISFMGDIFRPMFETVLGIVGTVFKTVFGVIGGVVSGFLMFLGGFLEGVADIFAGIVNILTNVFLGNWDGVIEGAKQILRGFAKVVGSIILGIGTTVVNIFRSTFDLIGGIISGFINFLRTFVSTLVTIFLNMGRMLYDVFVVVWDKSIALVKGIVRGLINFLKSFVGSVRGVFSKVGELLHNVFFSHWNSVFEKVKNLAKRFIGALGRIFLGIGGFVTGMFKKGGTIFKGFTEGVANVFKRLVNNIIRGINLVVSTPFNALNRSLNRFTSISILGKRPFGFIGYNPVPVPRIPQLASGAELRDETTATMAEYVGAKNNPEIVSPQNIMASTVGAELDKRLGAFTQEGGDLQLIVNVDGKRKVEEMVEDYNKYKMRGGKLSFVG